MENTPPATIIELVSVLVQGIGVVALVVASYSLGTRLSAVVTKLDMLSTLPNEVVELKLKAARMESDLQALWNQFRDFCKSQETHDDTEKERLAAFLDEWDRRRPINHNR